MKVYHGARKVNGIAYVWFDWPDHTWGKLPLRLDLRNHSPDGPEWGYGGSGPAQLALALLADATGSAWCALQNYQRFKREVIAGLPRDGWSMRQEDVIAWVDEDIPIGSL